MHVYTKIRANRVKVNTKLQVEVKNNMKEHKKLNVIVKASAERGALVIEEISNIEEMLFASH